MARTVMHYEGAAQVGQLYFKNPEDGEEGEEWICGVITEEWRKACSCIPQNRFVTDQLDRRVEFRNQEIRLEKPGLDLVVHFKTEEESLHAFWHELRLATSTCMGLVRAAVVREYGIEYGDFTPTEPEMDRAERSWQKAEDLAFRRLRRQLDAIAALRENRLIHQSWASNGEQVLARARK